MITTAELREAPFDPIVAAPDLFRRVIEAAAQPGRVVDLGPLTLTVPPPRLRPACALLLSRLDREASFHVLGPERERIRTYLRFHTGARAAALADAEFVLVTASGTRWDAARRAAPDASCEAATVVCVPEHLSNVEASADLVLRLDGPGIAGARVLSIRGLRPEDLAPVLDGPLSNVDVWLAAADGSLAVIPRSTHCR